MALDWNDLRILLAVLRYGSLNGAARMLGVSQPTISRRIAGIEEALGTRLFDRDTYGLSPTPACAALTSSLERMDEEALGVLRKLAAQTGALEGELTVTSIDWLGDAILAPLLARFGRRHPQLKVRLLCDERNFNLAAREAELTIAFRTLEHDNLVQRQIATVAYGLYATPAYLARCGPLEDVLNSHVSVQVERDGGAWLNEDWQRAVLGEAHVALRVNNMHAVLGATLAGEAIGHLPRPLAQRHAALVHLPAPMPDPELQLRIGFHADMRDSPRLRALVDYLVAELPGALAAPPIHPEGEAP